MGAKCPNLDGVWYPESGGEGLYITKMGCQIFKFTRYPGDFTFTINIGGKSDCQKSVVHDDKYCGEGKLQEDGKISIKISEDLSSTSCKTLDTYIIKSDEEIDNRIIKDCKNPPFKFDKSYRYLKKVSDKVLQKRKFK